MSNAQQASKQRRAKTERRPNERLKAHRLKKNWTQVYVATMVGTSDVEVSLWFDLISGGFLSEKMAQMACAPA